MLSVVIGRFQTPYLHEGHLEILREAQNHSENLLILIGCTAASGTDKNPLDFKTRKALFNLNCEILPLHDCPSDKDWSDKIDSIIADLGFEEATIFGGRDNSIDGYYLGKHKIKVIDERGGKSATALRKLAAEEPRDSSDFRAGIIYHALNRYPIVYSTVDVAIYCLDNYGNLDSILMGKKGDKFNFVGGFVDPQDESLQHAAYRELQEETGLKENGRTLVDMKYEFSSKVQDRRYNGTKDSIMTHFFGAWMLRPELPDFSKISDKEFKEFAWIPANEKSLDLIADCHKSLFLKFINSKN